MVASYLLVQQDGADWLTGGELEGMRLSLENKWKHVLRAYTGPVLLEKREESIASGMLIRPASSVCGKAGGGREAGDVGLPWEKVVIRQRLGEVVFNCPCAGTPAR